MKKAIQYISDIGNSFDTAQEAKADEIDALFARDNDCILSPEQVDCLMNNWQQGKKIMEQ